MAELRLVRVVGELHAGGTVTYRAYDGDRLVGLVGDGREWRGHKYGGRRWWAAWRERGDKAARASTGGLTCSNRSAAVAWLDSQAVARPEQSSWADTGSGSGWSRG
jgi:hypothetical protein